MKKIKDLGESIFYSFPVQLLINHFRRNHVMLLCWILLLLIISGRLGTYTGIPYLFLDPEYLNVVGFNSFFIMGIVLAGFSIAFHIATYIMDGHRFSFIGTVGKPFTKFTINNSIIPVAFLLIYIIFIIRYQVNNEYITANDLFKQIGGLLTGYLLMTFILYIYFWFTNKDIFKYVVCKVDEKLKQNIKLTRASAMKKLDIARKKQVRVDNFIDIDFRVKNTFEYGKFYNRSTILQVFDQNHFNLVIIETVIFMLLLTMGIFKDYPIFQIPAAASVILFLTVFVMFAGAFTYWFGRWSATAALVIVILLNVMVEKNIFTKTYKAFGLNYKATPAIYDLTNVNAVNSLENQEKDRRQALVMLNNWKSKFQDVQPPKLVITCVSGGGQRSALWTLNALQKADSITNNELFKHTVMITGASGGLIGAAYYRELYLRKVINNGSSGINLNDDEYLRKISSDNLNPIIFSLLANDLFVGFQKFTYKGEDYLKDRGYSFEEQLNKNTDFVLDKSLGDYSEPELAGKIPMMIMAPIIINDGRKLYIASQNISYMSGAQADYDGQKQSGIDFLRFFKDQDSHDLRFLSALRMSATFPYITPNTMLPSTPAMKIMDAGISDNFGISDAVQFIDAHKEWINENTSGVILLAIRDSRKEHPIKPEQSLSLFDRLFLPISSIYQNFENMQTINNDIKIGYAKEWLNGSLEVINLQYIPEGIQLENLSTADSLRMENTHRASLSWRLTSREKQSLIDNIYSPHNIEALQRLKISLSQTMEKPLLVRINNKIDDDNEEGVN